MSGTVGGVNATRVRWWSAALVAALIGALALGAANDARAAVNTTSGLVGMPSVAISGPRWSPHNGLVDSEAGKCLPGTVDLVARGQTKDLRGESFKLIIDRESDKQPNAPATPFIDHLEAVDSQLGPDQDTGRAFIEFPAGPFYGAATTPSPIALNATITALDGTVFVVTAIVVGPSGDQDTYTIQVAPDPANASIVTEARFEYCARININAGDSDLGNDGFIEFDSGSGGVDADEINVINPRIPTEDVVVMKTAEPVWIKQISWDIDKKIHGVSDTPTFVDYQLWKLFTGDIADVWYRVEVDKKATHRFRVRGEIEIWNLTSTAITVTHINDEVVVGGAPNSPRVTHPVPIDLSMPNCTVTSTLTVSAELRSSATLDIPAGEHAKCRYAKFLGTSKDAFVGP